MGMYFYIGDETLWNPSNGAGRLFLRQVEIFESGLELPSGTGQGKHEGDPDTLEVDPAVQEIISIGGGLAHRCRWARAPSFTG